MRRLAVLLAGAAFLIGCSGAEDGPTSSAPPISSLTVQTPEAPPAEPVNCVTKAEYAQLRNGMTPADVAGIVGTSGTQYASFGSLEGRRYKACGGSEYTGVWVDYQDGSASKLTALWP